MCQNFIKSDTNETHKRKQETCSLNVRLEALPLLLSVPIEISLFGRCKTSKTYSIEVLGAATLNLYTTLDIALQIFDVIPQLVVEQFCTTDMCLSCFVLINMATMTNDPHF